MPRSLSATMIDAPFALPSLNLTHSPFHEVLNTNYVPNDAEIELIGAHLAPHDAELSRLESIIAALAIQRDRVLNYVAPHRALTSKGRRIPQDILEQIFLACLPTHRNALMHSTEPPLVLARVCSSWRFIAFSTPKLWASLHIPANTIGTRAKMVAMVEWLERSAPHPLMLSVNIANSFETSVLSLRLSMPNIHTLFLLSNASGPLLTDLDIVFAPRWYSDLTFRGFPAIRRMSISGDGLAGVPTSMLIDRPVHVTHLNLSDTIKNPPQHTRSYLSSPGIYELVKMCQNQLISLQISTWGFDGLGLHDSLSVVRAPCLQFLSITTAEDYCYSRELAILLVHLQLPQLNSLHLPSYNRRTGQFDNLVLHLTQHSPSLCDVDFGMESNSLPDALRVLITQLSPTLRRLTIRKTTLYYAETTEWPLDLAAFAPRAILPNLWSLETLQILGGVKVTNQSAWIEFVNAHLEYKTSLRNFRLSILGEPPMVMPRPEAFRGMDVAVTYTVTEM
ncbi:hypothetical protein R3P38DRAFT_2892539 [Favolaschia claudopus]|uniref:F-box domain-containing protein n=1 Tax=Favolaschia claudopus TaxID=2862362 RepID=A0AAW0CNK1_9AGAR